MRLDVHLRWLRAAAPPLEAYRLAEEMSQKEFTKFLGMAPQSLCDLEKGRRVPTFARTLKIAQKLKKPAISWLKLVIEDQLREAHLAYKVELRKVR